MKKLEPVQSPFEETPSPIIWNILSRLPTKSCLNCKLVCKDWYIIIISSEFHNLRSSHCPFFTVLLYGQFYNTRTNFLFLDLDRKLKVDEMGNLNVSSDAMIKFKSKFTIPHHKLFVVNECNGLVCFKAYGRWTPYVICNLLTGQEVVVEQVCKPSCSVEVFGFGCCPVSRLFKILRFLNMRNCKSKAEVYTLGTNEWRVVGDAPMGDFRSTTAFLHGSLHRCSYSDNCIWSFHFGSEQFFNFPGPGGISANRHSDLSAFESCLSLCSVTEDCSQCENWVMKEYCVRDSWVKLFVFDTEFSSTHMPLLRIDDTKVLVSYVRDFSLGIGDIESGKCKRAYVLGVSLFTVLAGNVKFSKM